MRHLIPLVAVATLVLAACGGRPASSPSPTPVPSTAAATSQMLRIFISSEILAGKNRFLLSLTDRARRNLAGIAAGIVAPIESTRPDKEDVP